MGILKRILLGEFRQLNRLSEQGQKFITSVILFNTLNPIFSIFINAFLWRQSQEVSIVALYNLATYITLPLGFYLNGLLLKKTSVRRLYYGGAILRAAAVMALLFVPVITPLTVVLFGLFLGINSGIFWSNRNILTLKLTRSDNRIFFTSLDFMSSTFSNIIVPVLIGSLIVSGKNTNLYDPIHGYYVLGIITVGLTALFGLVIKKLSIRHLAIPKITLRNASKNWNIARSNIFVFGLFSGVNMFLPTVIILQSIGNEKALGTVQSLAAVVASFALYFVARSINTNHRIRMIALAIILGALASLSLSLSYSTFSIMLFVVILSFAQPLLFTEMNSLNLDLIDKESNNSQNHYAYIFDSEIVLNFGRITGTVIFFIYMMLFSNEFAIRIVPLLLILSQGFMIIFSKAIVKNSETTTAKPRVSEAYATDNMLQ